MRNPTGATHISGLSGSGKTVLAIAFAAQATRLGHVLWVNTDGKLAFVDVLRRNIYAVEGRTDSLSVIRGHRRALEAIRAIPDSLREDTCLVVIDPITRVLDLGRKKEVMWGRELFEEALPTLTGTTVTRDIALVVTSETRQLEDGPKPVYQEAINRFMDRELSLSRIYGSKTTEITHHDLNEGKESSYGTLKVTAGGKVQIELFSKTQEVRRCSGSQYV